MIFHLGQTSVAAVFFSQKLTKVKTIFHWEKHSRWVPNAEKNRINNMKCTWPTRKCCVGDPPPPIFHWKWGSRWVANEIYTKKWNVHGQRKELASHNAKDTNMLVYFALGNAKFWHRVHCPTPTPDARYFASQWIRLKKREKKVKK